MHPKVEHDGCFFFFTKIPLETARSAGFSNGFVWNARVWIGVFQLVEAPLGSEVSLYTTCISLDSCILFLHMHGICKHSGR